MWFYLNRQIYHWISVPILAELSGRSENKIRKTYHSVITDECIPLSEIPRYLVDKYLSEFLLRDKLIDFSFLNAIKSTDYESPLYSVEVQELFREMKMLREGAEISNACNSITIPQPNILTTYNNHNQPAQFPTKLTLLFPPSIKTAISPQPPHSPPKVPLVEIWLVGVGQIT